MGLRWLAAGFAAVAVPLGVASAAPLPPEICANLKAEVAELEVKGLRAAMARGPDTAKSTLNSDQLTGIRRLLDLDAQLIFRCSRDRPYVALKPEPTEQLDTIEPGPDGAAAAPVPAPPKPKAAKVPPKVQAAQPAASAPPPAAKVKARAKADDAFKPSPPVTLPVTLPVTPPPVTPPEPSQK